MKDKPNKDKPTTTPRPKKVLGKIPEGQFDTQLEQGLRSTDQTKSTRTAGIHTGQRKSKPLPQEAAQGKKHETPAPTPEPQSSSLKLPPGGLVTMRRSGGFRFTSRGVTVYADGHTIIEGTDTPHSAHGRTLSDANLAELYRALEAANFDQLPATSGKQNPDAYAYEIAARTAGQTYSLETFDGSISAQLAPLIRLLSRYLDPAS